MGPIARTLGAFTPRFRCLGSTEKSGARLKGGRDQPPNRPGLAEICAFSRTDAIECGETFHAQLDTPVAPKRVCGSLYPFSPPCTFVQSRAEMQAKSR